MTRNNRITADKDTTPLTGKSTTKVQKDTKVATIPNRGTLDYNVPEIEKFIATVFHDERDGESIIGFVSKTNRPSYPKHIDDVLNKLEKIKIARVCYFGTATVTPDPEDGKLYNRNELFKRLHVVVLDDIGTKVPLEDLPEELRKPTYIIESSEGNFQYGYALDKPIDNPELAKVFISAVYGTKYSDGGGALATKAVRLPCGINGKEGEKGDFHVTLRELNEIYWTPTQLLNAVDAGIDWEKVKVDPNIAKRGKSKTMGTAVWSPLKPTAESFDGIVDPVLEWLYENNMVRNDNGSDFVQIRCPWAHEHSDKQDTASYSPVGRGSRPQFRGFNCFHEHCSGRNSQDFLDEIYLESGIEAPVFDQVAPLVADYAFSAVDNAAVRIRGVNRPETIKIEGFKNMHRIPVPARTPTGTPTTKPAGEVWLSAKHLLRVHGLRYDPSTPDLVFNDGGYSYINLYSPPDWGAGSYDQADVDMFKQFIEYLVPNDDERDYFYQWLAAKVQNITFRGAGILMVAPVQGTGRTTLSNMVRTLFTPANVSKVTFDQLAGAVGSGKFNDFMEAAVITCDEVMSDTVRKYSVYESVLKEMIDPLPKDILINVKHGAQRINRTYSSFLLMTNHIDAIGQLGEDRRIYVIANATQRNTPEYYTELNEWLSECDEDGKPFWAKSVWRWLLTFTPDLQMLNSPAPRTEIKGEMIEATKSLNDFVAQAIIQVLDGVLPSKLILQDLANAILCELKEPDDDRKKSTLIANLCSRKSCATSFRHRFNGKQSRVRMAYDKANELGLTKLNSGLSKQQNDTLLGLCATAEHLFSNEQQLVQNIVDIVESLQV